jgi:ABC-type lipoprotein export system ATPase subunit
VGFVFQFYNLIPSLTARDERCAGDRNRRTAMSPDEALALVGLEARVDHFPAQMSGGERQRVAITRAIAKRSEVLLCDEPTGALGSKTGIRVLEALTAGEEDALWAMSLMAALCVMARRSTSSSLTRSLDLSRAAPRPSDMNPAGVS